MARARQSAPAYRHESTCISPDSGIASPRTINAREHGARGVDLLNGLLSASTEHLPDTPPELGLIRPKPSRAPARIATALQGNSCREVYPLVARSQYENGL